jgi:hypothetical protein
MEKLGLGPEVPSPDPRPDSDLLTPPQLSQSPHQVLCARNPKLIFARLTGYGQDAGACKDWAGHDINYMVGAASAPSSLCICPYLGIYHLVGATAPPPFYMLTASGAV